MFAGFCDACETSLCEEPSLLSVTPRYLACCSIVSGVPLVKWTVLCEAGERGSTHFLRFKWRLL